MKTAVFTIAIATSFFSGFAFKSVLTNEHLNETSNMKKVTGIGGIFFKCKDPQQLKNCPKNR